MVVERRNESLEAGRKLAHPPPGEEIVISGLTGAFPESNNVTEFAENLFDKIDMITDDDRRWKLEHPEIPKRTGKLKTINKFDAAFFGIHYKQAHTMDPMCRMLIEQAYEAIVDSGYNPRSLYGTRMGVFIGACFSESEKTWLYEKLQVNGFGITGCSRAMLANRISYWLGVNGPSYTLDSACSSSLYAIEHGYRAIRDGLCDSAIVGGCNLCLHPYVSLQFSRLGVLSLDGLCKSFDESANGYCRSEAISVVFLQKKKDARRIYATLVHAKTNCDGYKEQGITFPSGPVQQILLEDFYEECKIDPGSLAWVEAHGTGTRVGDPEEVHAIENIFCKNRKGPLKIGSVKSNIGHAEPTSGLCSIAKVIIAMETGFIPPNINFNTPRADIEALHNNTIQVVTEKTPWEGGLVGVNSFGFGGANCHVLLNWNEKNKMNNGIPKDNLPRLVNISGRTKEAVDSILTYLESNPVDAEYVKLYHEIHKDEIPGHIYRGYTILHKNQMEGVRDIQYFTGQKRPVWYVFSPLGCEWSGMGCNLMEYAVFSSTINKLSMALKPFNVNLSKIINDRSLNLHTDPLKSILGLTAIQIGLFDLLSSIGLIPDGLIGESVGEIACAYANGCLTAEEAILVAYHITAVIKEANLKNGSMSIIRLSETDLEKICPVDIDIISSYNGQCTISGPEKSITDFTKEVKANNVSVEIVSSKLALHSRIIANIAQKLLQTLRQVISQPKLRTDKWISSCVVGNDLKVPTKSVNAEYICHLILNKSHFGKVLNKVPVNGIAIEVSPSSLFQHVLQKTLKKGTVIPLLKKEEKGNNFFLSAIGKIFVNGGDLDIAKLYPEVSFPVSRSTPMIAPLLKWEHSEDWYVTSYRMQEKINSGERTVSISLMEDELEYISGHVIDGRNLFPATGYLQLAWETLALMRGDLYTEVPVIFENVRFHRATNLSKDGVIEFIVMVQKVSGNFEIVEGGAAIVTGRIYVPDNVEGEMSGLTPPEPENNDKDLLGLDSKDIYKELKLRGYHYKGLFRSLTYANNTATHGRIKWQNNWVAFIDNMLQLQILQVDTRGLFVPTSIERVVIDVKKHGQILQTLPEDSKEFPIYNNKDVELMICGGVEIRSPRASPIPRRKPLGEPVLEKYSFVPHVFLSEMLGLSEVVRVFVHLALENEPTISVKVVEVADSTFNPNPPLLAPIISQTLGDLPLIQAEIVLLTQLDNPLLSEVGSEISVDDRKLMADQSALIVCASNIIQESQSDALTNCLGALREGGFLITREKMDIKFSHDELIQYAIHSCSGEFITLFRKVKMSPKPTKIVNILEDNLSWLPELKEALASEENKRVIIVSENNPFSGILGLVNCIRKEPNGAKARCVLIMDQNAPKFSLDNHLYSSQLDKDLAINVYKNGKWGSYRHLPLEEQIGVDCFHAYVNVTTKGDLSTLKWLQGPIVDPSNIGNQKLVNIYYSALNFRDIMTATAKISSEVVAKSRLNQDCVQGLEYSGIDMNGRRVMGMAGQKGLASVVATDELLLFDIPSGWTLEDAATVPIVYSTAIFALMIRGKMTKGETVLIHAGSGGVGLASIQLCLYYGCTVYTTVGTKEKREFIKQQFPQLTDRHIGNSRDSSFEQLIMTETNGRGVDIVLNSLAEELLLASVRCLAPGGRFLEIGKFDLANNNPLGMETFMKETSFHGIMLDSIFYDDPPYKRDIVKLMNKSLYEGAVRPITRKVFKNDEVEQAFRYMAAGKHIGKVLIKVKDEPETHTSKPQFVMQKAQPRFYCHPNKSYIVIGGLGGFGLELAEWLVIRGCLKLILTSRTGLRNGYQSMRIRLWRSYGVTVKVSTNDVTTSEGVITLLKEANAIGPVGGIFNLAVVLRDAILENQTEKGFKESLAPKAVATQHLDNCSRTLCPELDQFVVFSSVSCGRGNPGQSNYGMANSVMERICEARASKGLPATAVQWGAVGDVGLVAEMQEDNIEIVIGGTLQQRIASCLNVLDSFITQKHPIVASMVVAEKRAGSGSSDNVVDTVANILGLRDLKTVSLHSTLAELGMDSMMAVEIKQTLERDFEVFLTPQDIRSMTFAKLHDIASKKDSGQKKADSEDTSGLPVDKSDIALRHLLKFIGDEKESAVSFLRLPSLYKNGCTTDEVQLSETVILIPGIEGVGILMEPLAVNLRSPVICLQIDYKEPYDTIHAFAVSQVNVIKTLSPSGPYNLVGYSFGGLIAIEMVRILEEEGQHVNLWLIDSSPVFTQKMAHYSFGDTEENIQNKLLMWFIDIIWPQDKIKLSSILNEIKSWDSKIELLINSASLNEKYSKEYQKQIINAYYNRIKAVIKYEGPPPGCLLNSSVVLIRPTEMSVPADEDYCVSKFCKNHVSVHFIDGNHVTILEKSKTAEFINGVIHNRANVTFKKPLLNDPEEMRKVDDVKQI